jgi:hypothetical protein
MQYLIDCKCRQWTVLTMGTGVFDSDWASVDDHTTSVRDAQAGFFLLLCSNQSGLKKGKAKEQFECTPNCTNAYGILFLSNWTLI